MGAGGTDGGFAQFVLGFILFIAGIYLFLSELQVYMPFFGGRGAGGGLFNVGGYNITTGYVFIPMLIGIGIMFYDAAKNIGWFLFIGSLIALIFGVIANTTVNFSNLSAFDLIVIFFLIAGGLGLILSAMRTSKIP